MPKIRSVLLMTCGLALLLLACWAFRPTCVEHPFFVLKGTHFDCGVTR